MKTNKRKRPAQSNDDLEVTYRHKIVSEQLENERQFVLQDFRVTDSGLAALLGADALAVYYMLRRFVWRKNTSGDDLVNAEYEVHEDGLRNLSTNRSILNLAEYTGMDRRAISKSLQRLCDFGVIYEVPRIDGQKPPASASFVWRLGRRDLGDREVFFLDEVAAQAYDAIMKIVEERFDEPTRKHTAFMMPISERKDFMIAALSDYVRREGTEEERQAALDRLEAALDRKKPRGNPHHDRRQGVEIVEPKWTRAENFSTQPAEEPTDTQKDYEQICSPTLSRFAHRTPNH